jgi:hypothetical protein
VTAIEERALRSEAMGLHLGVACKLNLLNERLGKLQAPTQAPKTALKLFVSVPSLLQAHPSIDNRVVVFLLSIIGARAVARWF